jgi:hypothetical protein
MREAFWVYRWQTWCNNQDACSSYTSSLILPTYYGNNVLYRWHTFDSHGILLVVSYTYVFEVSVPAENSSQPICPWCNSHMTIYHSLYSIYCYMEASSSLSAEPRIGAVPHFYHRATHYGNSPSYLSVGASLQVQYISQYSHVCIPIHIHGVLNF